MLFYLMLENIKIMDWIDVNDRLPHTEQPVLTFSEKNLSSELLEMSAIDSKGIWYCWVESKDVEDPLYWMPLPEPPKQ